MAKLLISVRQGWLQIAKKITGISDRFYTWRIPLQRLLILLYLAMLIKYLSVDVAEATKYLQVDYGFYNYAGNNPFKTTEIIRYVSTCIIFFVLLLNWLGQAKRCSEIASPRTKSISNFLLLTLAVIEAVMWYNNSHVHGAVFWSCAIIATFVIICQKLQKYCMYL